MGFQLLYGAAVFGASVQALAFPSPRPTDPFQALPQDGWSPRPTPEPYAPALFRRQNGLPSTYLLAPDQTCGFINGSPSEYALAPAARSPIIPPLTLATGSAYICGGDLQCAFIPASGKVPGAAGCCNSDQCAFRVSCLDDSKMDSCDDACQANTMTLKW
jgi:hypothetical protein